jgi:hypothetical protein
LGVACACAPDQSTPATASVASNPTPARQCLRDAQGNLIAVAPIVQKGYGRPSFTQPAAPLSQISRSKGTKK